MMIHLQGRIKTLREARLMSTQVGPSWGLLERKTGGQAGFILSIYSIGWPETGIVGARISLASSQGPAPEEEVVAARTVCHAR